LDQSMRISQFGFAAFLSSLMVLLVATGAAGQNGPTMPGPTGAPKNPPPIVLPSPTPPIRDPVVLQPTPPPITPDLRHPYANRPVQLKIPRSHSPRCPDPGGVYQTIDEISGTLAIGTNIVFTGDCFGNEQTSLMAYVSPNGTQVSILRGVMRGLLSPASWSPTRVEFKILAYDPNQLQLVSPEVLVFDILLPGRKGRFRAVLSEQNITTLKNGGTVLNAPTFFLPR
jgi:hypothetical protein